METRKSASFFLGANTPQGFHSLYEDFVRPEAGDFLWVLKGAPGCGKSGFMGRIAAAARQAGLEVERIFCSGDPDSLDGVYIPQRRLAYVDGTAPHVIEPLYPGAAGAYLDLSRFIDSRALGPALPELMALNRHYTEKYREAYDLLAALPTLSPGSLRSLLTPEDVEAGKSRARRSAARLMPRKQSPPGLCRRRFLSAFSGSGETVLTETLSALCSRIYLPDYRLGLGAVYLREIAEHALRQGYGVILCPDPLAPEHLEAVLLPELSVGYVARALPEKPEGAKPRHIRLDEIPSQERLGELLPALRAIEGLRGQILRQAHSSLSQAKALHDELERLYHPHVDFDGVFAEARRHIEAMLG